MENLWSFLLALFCGYNNLELMGFTDDGRRKKLWEPMVSYCRPRRTCGDFYLFMLPLWLKYLELMGFNDGLRE